MKILNYILLLLTCIVTINIPAHYLDHEVLILNALGLGYLSFYIFFISKKHLFDLCATAFLLFFGLVFECLLSNYHFYFYGLVDYPYFTSPPAWVAVLWLVVPLQFYKLNFKYRFIPAAVIHTAAILLLQQKDLMFIQKPFEQNLIFIFIIWFMLYRLSFKSLSVIERLKVFKSN